MNEVMQIDTNTLMQELQRRGYIWQFWSVHDVAYKMAEMGYSEDIIKEESMNITKYIDKYADAEVGINWDVISVQIDDYLDLFRKDLRKKKKKHD